MKKLLLLFLLVITANIYAQQGNSVYMDTEKDSIQQLIADTAKVLRGEMSSGSAGIDYNMSITDYYSTPEQYKIYNTADTAIVRMAIDSSGGRPILFKNTYNVSKRIYINMQGGSKDLIFAKGAKIISTSPDSGTYYAPKGNIQFYNGARLTITGGEIEGNLGNSYTLLANPRCALFIDSVDQVELTGLDVKKGKDVAIWIKKADQVILNNVGGDSSGYAGIMITQVLKSNVYGGHANYNGNAFTRNGYGISFSHPFNNGGTVINNEDIKVDGFTAIGNYRKGVDVHGGLNITITNCYVERFGYGAYYAVNEYGYDVKRVKNVNISNNIAINDTAWYNATMTAHGVWAVDTTDTQHIIAVGSYNVEYTGTDSAVVSAGSFKVNNNIIDVDNSKYTRGAIVCFVNESGEALKSFQATGNTITNLYQHPGYSPLYAGILVLGHPTRKIVPRSIGISNNYLQGSAPYGIYVAYGASVITNDNQFEGTFPSNVIALPAVTDEDSTNVLRKGNLVNGVPLPNMSAESRYTSADRYSGNIERFTNSGGIDTVSNYLKLDMTTSGSAFRGKITVNEAVSKFTALPQIATWEGYVYAWIDASGGNKYHVADTLSLIAYNDSTGLTAPYFDWVGDTLSTATYHNAYLRGSLMDNNSSYYVTIEWNSYNVSPYILDDEDEMYDSISASTCTTGGHTIIKPLSITGDLDMQGYDILNADSTETDQFQYGIALTPMAELSKRTAISWSDTSAYRDSLTAGTDPTYTFTNVRTNAWITLVIYSNGANDITFPADIKWIGETAPTALTTDKYNYYQFWKSGWYITGMIIGTTD